MRVLPLLLTCLATLLTPALADSAPPELRGTWLTTTANTAFARVAEACGVRLRSEVRLVGFTGDGAVAGPEAG